MANRGFMLVEVLIGVFLLGLISITFFPIFTLISNQFKLIEIKSDMKYFAEDTIEKIKSFNFNSSKDEYILDMKLEELINIFYEKDEVKIILPLRENKKINYKIIIYKKDKKDNLWKIIVVVFPERKNMEGMKFETFIPKTDKK